MTTEATINLRGNYYADKGHLKTDIRKGVTRNRAGTRILSLTADFLRGIRAAIHHECGPAAEEVLKKCGRNWGTQFARRFAKEIGDHHGLAASEFPLALFEACLVEAFSLHGWGKLKLDFSRHDQGLIIATVSDAVFAELVGNSEQPVESLLTGILAGFFCHFSEQDLDCVQTQCKACGAEDSRFVIGLTKRLAAAAALAGQGRPHDDIVTAMEKVRD